MINKNISFGSVLVVAGFFAGTGLVGSLESRQHPFPIEAKPAVSQAARTARDQPAAGEPSSPVRRARNEALAEPAFDALASQTCPRCR